MQPLENEINPKMVRVWQINSLITSGIGLIITIAYFIFMMKFDWTGWIFGALVIGLLAYAPLGYLVFPSLRQRYHSYQLNEEEIEIQHGMFVVQRVLVPMIRIQHITIEQGPIMRKFGLTELKVSTAAMTHDIPGLTMREAEQLKRQISELAKVSDEDV
ncbi:PH domain-containing protein [Bacillus cereus group sp. BfR-BA-01380]|uniref:PH domain-containing protein n=1 Tax=Bacillus cereus group sp. BfR-BA-01380 TaxID=2920324 RepID=UPI001F58BD04|nr:PH domain-containing protein [Bacillus cereus group sp. BfR-BA-01380]